ncbi:MAG: hypothetical protein U0136_08460 [Bdellovibrionota bacterium]
MKACAHTYGTVLDQLYLSLVQLADSESSSSVGFWNSNADLQSCYGDAELRNLNCGSSALKRELRSVGELLDRAPPGAH